MNKLQKQTLIDALASLKILAITNADDFLEKLADDALEIVVNEITDQE